MLPTKPFVLILLAALALWACAFNRKEEVAPDARAFSVQYHPEAAAGPHDAFYLFKRFADLMRG